ncbi:MAG TPA: aldo/keto reductase [Spirochaetia bacterium]|nr:aldo/keto reductase [Spirochaetia bacterium]
MQFRHMKKIDQKVSALGFGVMRLAGRGGMMRLRVDEKRAITAIRRGIELGINYFDTAYIYHLGASERILGQALRDGYRQKVLVADKLPMILMRRPEDFSRFLETQLKRLGTDHIDFYLFHSMNRAYLKKMRDFDLLPKMEDARRRGLIRYIGFSFHDTLPIFKEVIDAYAWDMTQIQYNYLDTGVQATTEGLKYAYAKGIPVVVMEGLRGGKLANPPMEALQAMRDGSSSRTPVDWAFQFLWNQEEVTTVLSGMNSAAMVEENCRYADRSGVGTLTGKDQEVIRKLVDVYRQKILVGCTACNYCMPCPHGVNIPESFAQLNMSNGPRGLQSWLIRRNYGRLASRRDRVNRAVPNGNASLCTQCKVCVPQCPQGIDIPTELAKVDLVLGKRRRIEEVFG